MASQPERGAARIHWLVAGRFSQTPRGESFVASSKDLDTLLAARLGEVRVRVPDRLGAAESREVVLTPRSLRAFTLAGVVEALPELAALRKQGGRSQEALDAAVFGTALDVLGADPVRALEASWRGLRLLLAACPEDSDIQVEVLDALPGDQAVVSAEEWKALRVAAGKSPTLEKLPGE
jgi:hypothetical protein